MKPVTITIIAQADDDDLTYLDLEKTLDSLRIPGIVIEDYEIEMEEDAVSPEQAAFERREYELDMLAAYYS